MSNVDVNRCLASLAVFRELYDDADQDVYAIIVIFLNNIIRHNRLRSFRLREITGILNDTHGFNIPESVVKASLKRIESISLDNGQYTLAEGVVLEEHNGVDEKYQETKTQNDIIHDSLFSFIESESDEPPDKEELVAAFFSYLLDKSVPYEWSDYFDAFIVENKGNVSFTGQLNKIKQGVILHTGLVYTPNLGDLGSWHTELVVYLEAEILFHSQDFNGELFKELFDDFYAYVREVNTASMKKRGTKLVRLRVFPESINIVNSLFSVAEYLIRDGRTVDPSKTAIVHIMSTCQSPSDVVQFRTRFFERLKAMGITIEEPYDYTDKDAYRFNLEDRSVVQKMTDQYGEEKVVYAMRMLSHVNVLRKGESCSGFENVGHILLTETNATINLAWHPSVKSQGHVPLATNLHFIINKFWFKLRKGFGSGAFPKSFDVITNAQMALSAKLSHSLSENYKKAKEQYQAGEIDEATAIETIADLKSKSRTAEEINEENVEDVLSFIKEGSIEHLRLEREKVLRDANKNAAEAAAEKDRIAAELAAEQKARNEIREILAKTQKELEGFKAAQTKQERRKKLFRKFGFIALMCVLLAVGYYFYSAYNKVLGYAFGFLAFLFAVLAFCGVDLTKAKAFLKRGSQDAGAAGE